MKVDHASIYRDPYSYCSHPSIRRLADGEWVIAFMESMRRSVVLRSPSDPRFYNVLTRSIDRDLTWSTPRVIPGVDQYGLECPSLTQLGDGQILHGQWRWRWRPRDVDRDTDRPLGRYERPGHPWAPGDDGFCVHRSLDGGNTWITGERIDTAPYSGA